MDGGDGCTATWTHWTTQLDVQLNMVGGGWAARLVKRPTLDFPGHDLGVLGSSPLSSFALSGSLLEDFLSPSSPPPFL